MFQSLTPLSPKSENGRKGKKSVLAIKYTPSPPSFPPLTLSRLEIFSPCFLLAIELPIIAAHLSAAADAEVRSGEKNPFWL